MTTRFTVLLPKEYIILTVVLGVIGSPCLHIKAEGTGVTSSPGQGFLVKEKVDSEVDCNCAFSLLISLAAIVQDFRLLTIQQ